MALIHLANRQKDLLIQLPSVRVIVNLFLQIEKVECHEVSISLVSERRICQLHKQYFDDPSPTDCISFPLDNENLGDIFVCPKAALDYTASHGGDPYRETTLYIIHGLLHLIGYDDIDPSSRKFMRKKEKKLMAHIEEQNIFLRGS